MKHLVFNIDDIKYMKSAQKEANKICYISKLIQVFTAITDEKKLSKIITELTKEFPNSTIIGTTTAGEIANANMYDNSTIVSISLFKKSEIKADYIKNIDKAAGVKLSKKICSKKTKAAVILSEGLYGEDYEGFIKGFREYNTDIIVAGGLAGDNFKLKKTLIFLNNQIYKEGSVAVSFSGISLFADNKYNLNWTPIGKKFTITKSEKNIVHEIDEQNSVELFKKYLGQDILRNNAEALSEFQFLYKDGSTTVSRTPMAIDKGSLVFAAPIKEGQEVQFGFSNAASVISGSNNINEEIKNKPAQAIYIFSCIARKRLLGKKLEDEFQNFESIAPSAGFFTYGEYYSTNMNNALLNCTTTLLILSESKKTAKKKKKLKNKSYQNLDDITFSALTHFIQQTADELNSNAKLLNQYKNVVDSSLLVSKTDKNGIITYVNNNFCRISKYKKDELIGKNHNIVRNDNVSSFIFKKMWSSIQSGKVWRGQFPNKAKDNSTYYVNATIMPTYNEKENIDGYIAVREDITKQIIAKKKMKEKEKLIKAIFDNQENIVVFSSKENGMLNANKTLYKYFDYKNFNEFKSKHDCICDLFIEEENHIHPNKDSEWLDTIANNDSIDHKVKMSTKDNNVHTFNIKVNKINDEYIINLSDITNLEAALQKAYSSEQAKSMFLANMSHEIRTPLNGILGFTDVLTKRQLDKESKKYVDVIHKSGESLLNVVNDILDFSKIESGELSLYEIESNLFKEMEAAVSIFASTSRIKHIDYYTFIDTNIPKTLKCDVQRIKQILSNLISNAIKFTPKGGIVSVNISLKKIKNGNAIIDFSVKDSGIGIENKKLSNIFKPFSQADNSISREFGGTGLGLSISSRYAQLMNSKLKVSSKKDRGSKFYFELKLPITNSSQNVEKKLGVNEVNINILQNNYGITCGINEIVSTYLNTWGCNYKIINSLNELNEKTDILIVCAKLFDQDSCKDALIKYSDLQLIYVEGGGDNLECAHPKYHVIQQQMTGSSLFDKIVTITYDKEIDIDITENLDSHEAYNGKILIAEDNETNQMLISVMLDEREIEYTIVPNGQKAVDEALSNEYDLIFMDINMPILDGVSATKILREKNYSKAIVSLSANVIESDIETFLKAGVDDTLNKPIVDKELDKILKKYLKQKIRDEINDYDIVDLNKISNDLSIPNKNIILKLIFSFSKSAQVMIETLENKNLDMDILHTLKGISGNLRFNNLYNLTVDFEKEYHEWDDNMCRNNSNKIISHLNELVKNIALFNK